MHDKNEKRLHDDLSHAAWLALTSLSRNVEDGLSPAEALMRLESFVILMQRKGPVAVMTAATQLHQYPCRNNHANN